MAVRDENRKFDLKRICEECAIDEADLRTTPISEEVLKQIYDDFDGSKGVFDDIRLSILADLNNLLKGQVHSIRARMKDPDHLIGKIIRNVNEKPEKYSNITVENYNKIITDLIGIRIIILNKHDWRGIHRSLLQIFRNIPERYIQHPPEIETNYDKYAASDDRGQWRAESYHAEMPVVYITSEEDRTEYVDDYLRIDTAKKHYRSIHYIIRYGKIYFEIQVRTLFEEGWLEFDHRVKYPNDRNNSKKLEYIEILSSLAVAADRLIAFYNENEDDFMNDHRKAAGTACGEAGEAAETKAAVENAAPPCETIQDKMKSRF